MNQYQKIANYTISRISELDKKDVIDTIINGLRYVFGAAVPGDIAEFGTMTGRTAVAIAICANAFNERYREKLGGRGGKKLWYFDSFEGLPQARFEVDRTSHHVQAGIWAPGTCQGLSATEFTKLISQLIDKNDFFVVPGFYCDSVKTVDISRRFSFIHLDCVLYESALDSLGLLIERNQISPGALILFNSYNCNAANPAIGERLAWAELVKKFGIEYSDEGAYSVTARKFIFHRARNTSASSVRP